MVARMDDFDVVLGMEFFVTYHILPMPTTSYFMIIGEDLYIIPIQTKWLKETKIISALLFKRGMKWQELSFMAVLKGKEAREEKVMPKVVQNVLKSFKDVMSN